mgnify:CR=1 FL=1
MAEQSAKAESRYTDIATAVREAAKPGDMKPTVAPPDLEMAPGAESRPDPMRFPLSLLVAMMTSAVLFGLGIVTILGTGLADNASTLVWPMIAVTTLLGAIAGWVIAPRLRARNWAKRNAQSMRATYVERRA